MWISCDVSSHSFNAHLPSVNIEPSFWDHLYFKALKDRWPTKMSKIVNIITNFGSVEGSNRPKEYSCFLFTVGYDDDYIATKYGRRIRAASPVNYRRPLSERFDDGLTPRYSDHISHSVDHALRRNRYDNPARLHSSYVSIQWKRLTLYGNSDKCPKYEI